MPKQIGRYLVLEMIGNGATGAVYKALDPELARTVAIKTLRIDIPRESPEYQSVVDRILRQARLGAALSHPHIVTVFDVGEDPGLVYVAMEYLEGETIATLLARSQRLEPETGLALLRQVASAVDYAHAQGVIHRDIQPAHFFLYDRERERLKVTGFATGGLVGAETSAGSEELLFGTPAYMSPEHARGKKLDGRSDIFSLGVSAFEMLSGERPFTGDTVVSQLYNVMHVDPAEPAGLETRGFLAAKWREVFRRVLAKDPADRYPTASDFADDLALCLAVPEPVAPTPKPPLPVDENVQFTVYRPRAVERMRWYPLLAFAHLEELPPGAPDDAEEPAEQVRRQARQALGDLADDYGHARQDASSGIPHEAEITFVVEIPGFRVEPPSVTFRWLEPVHREDFRIRAGAETEGPVARGRMTVYRGRIVLADVSLSIRIESGGATAEPSTESSAARPYRKIFPSYSHQDVALVAEFERHGRALGDVYLRDVTTLRAGERWNEQLHELIREADVFQLFWSWNALRSSFVEKEWRYALSLDRAHFVRPTYWEQPLPALPDRDLPPEDLRRLHFHLLPRAAPSVPAPPVPRADPAPVTAAYPAAPAPPARAAARPLPSPVPESPTVSMRRPAPVPAPRPAASSGLPIGLLLALAALATLALILMVTLYLRS